MNATKAMEQRKQRQDSESQRESRCRTDPTALDARYGCIGISAVAAAVNQMAEAKPRVPANSKHALRYERE